MNLARLITLAIIIYLLVSYLGVVRSGLRSVITLVPRFSTLVEMGSYKEGLRGYLEHFGDFPPDLYQWLNENFATLKNPNPGYDRFGSPYLAHWEEVPILRSPGPDRLYYTKDDLIVVIWEKGGSK